MKLLQSPAFQYVALYVTLVIFKAMFGFESAVLLGLSWIAHGSFRREAESPTNEN